MKNFRYFFILLCLVIPFFLFGQPGDKKLHAGSKKSARSFNDAMKLLDVKDYEKAGTLLRKTLDQDPKFIEAWLLLGEVLTDSGNKEEAIDAYNAAVEVDSGFFPNVYYLLGDNELALGRYSESKKHLHLFLDKAKYTKEKEAGVWDKIERCDFGEYSLSHPVPFHPFELGDSVNSGYDDFINAITADEKSLFLTVRLPRIVNGGKQVYGEDFYRCVKENGMWSAARELGPPVNTTGNEGALFITTDGMEMFFAGCHRDDGYGSCDIYRARRQGDGWEMPVNLGKPVNSSFWDSQPSLSSDGKTLYFASTCSGGKGSSDIYMSIRQNDGSWSKPENLGLTINTAKSEMCPFIHPDGRTLYFSSTGHMGMGGYDLFVSKKDEAGHWTAPLNLGYPINTYADEINLVVDAKGELAYFSSDKLGGTGKKDIYAFPLYEAAKPAAVNYVKGLVFDDNTRNPLGADFLLIDLQSGDTTVSAISDPVNGEFLVTLPPDRNYALHVSKKGYLFFSENFSLSGGHSQKEPYQKDIPLKPILAGETVTLNNIFFETDKSELKPESRIELNRLVRLLADNKSLVIEIGGHTDNTGSAEYNQALSNSRAQVVFEYLVGMGISKTRLSYIGYGKKMPVSDNETEEGRRLNRRTEFKVISY